MLASEPLAIIDFDHLRVQDVVRHDKRICLAKTIPPQRVFQSTPSQVPIRGHFTLPPFQVVWCAEARLPRLSQNRGINQVILLNEHIESDFHRCVTVSNASGHQVGRRELLANVQVRKEIWNFGLSYDKHVNQQKLVGVVSQFLFVNVDTVPKLRDLLFDYPGHFSENIEFLYRGLVEIHAEIVQVCDCFLVGLLARVQSPVNFCERQGLLFNFLAFGVYDFPVWLRLLFK